MKIQGHGHYQSRNCKTVADFLHQDSGRSKGGRSDVVTAVVVYDDADSKVHAGCNATAECESLGVFARVCHLRDNGKVGWNSAKCEDDRSNGCHSFRECRLAEKLPCRDIGTILRRLRGTILNANRDGKREHYDNC